MVLRSVRILIVSSGWQSGGGWVWCLLCTQLANVGRASLVVSQSAGGSCLVGQSTVVLCTDIKVPGAPIQARAVHKFVQSPSALFGRQREISPDNNSAIVRIPMNDSYMVRLTTKYMES